MYNKTVCDAATMWYFVEEPDAFEAPNPARLTPSLVSLSIGVLNHSGSFAKAGLWFGLTRPLRLFKAWTNSRYFRYIAPPQRGGRAFYLPRPVPSDDTTLSKIGDVLTSNAFVEV